MPMCGECEMSGRTGTGPHGETMGAEHCSCWYEGRAISMERAEAAEARVLRMPSICPACEADLEITMSGNSEDTTGGSVKAISPGLLPAVGARAAKAEQELGRAQANLDANRSIRRYVAFVLAGHEEADVQVAADALRARADRYRALLERAQAVIAIRHPELAREIRAELQEEDPRE